jgi:hypothetical protein
MNFDEIRSERDTAVILTTVGAGASLAFVVGALVGPAGGRAGQGGRAPAAFACQSGVASVSCSGRF